MKNFDYPILIGWQDGKGRLQEQQINYSDPRYREVLAGFADHCDDCRQALEDYDRSVSCVRKSKTPNQRKRRFKVLKNRKLKALKKGRR
jgi:hypothetical protein